MTTKRAKPTYTEKLHRHRLRVMLGKGDPCTCCPAASKFNPKGSPSFLWSVENDPCGVCKDFIGVEFDCPCTELGQAEAIRRTLARLEED